MFQNRSAMKRLMLLLLALLLCGTGCRDRDYDPQAEIDRQGMEAARQERETKFPAATSYQLKLLMNRESGLGGATADIQKIFAEVLQSRMGQAGLNPHQGANAGDGELGEIAVELTAQQNQYQDGGHSIEIPTKFEATMKVTSASGQSSWDGEHTLVAEKAAPTSVRANGASFTREAQIRDLVEDMVEGLPEFSQ